MKKLDPQVVRSALIDLNQFATNFSNGTICLNNQDLINQIYNLIVDNNGYAICYNTHKIMARHGLNVSNKTDAEIARLFLEDTFRSVAKQIDLSKYSPIKASYDRIVKMDVDGYHVNKSFSPNDEHTPSREFVTTKCVHFDSATPFIANIYGPNQNIINGLPIICDTKKYCADNNIDPTDLVENIPNNYNVVVKKKHYMEILEDYSFALDIDLANDLVMVVLYNEIRGGVAHAATQPNKLVENAETTRPIRHVEYQFNNLEDLSSWYDYYKVTLTPATNHKADEIKLSLDYYTEEPVMFNHFIKVDNH